ncbi:lipopolysaccharide biosynthesis protein [Rosenbergiella epipactidis]|uniref:lipopolysaccharide biosynthesis protein n=1 Tax=Rosenbergiella epipactidis TaxID=1544694 RepID=UPI001F4E215D|nr:lipopolysaccharide biosynthesis protein [Rosenbergiella epipactidis]
MKNWFSDGAFRTILRNSVYLLSGNVVSALLGLLALSCAGKGMSPHMFGTLIVIQSYTKAISDFVKFQTWQFVVQYGTPAYTKGDHQRLRDVVAFSFGLDIASSIVAIAGGMLLLPFLSHSLGLDAASFKLALLYCTLIPTMASSTPTGILRTLDRFDLIAIQQAVKPLLIAIGSLISYFGSLGFAGFVVSWYVANLVGGSLFWWFARRELKRINLHDALRPSLFKASKRIPGSWNFVWATNLSHSIWAAQNSCSTLLVGIFIGPSAAGLFKIAMTFFEATGTPANLLYKSFYPEVMRLDPRTKKPWVLGIRSSLFAGLLGLIIAGIIYSVGGSVIAFVFGHKYLEAFSLIQIMLGAIVISMMGFPQESLLLMAGKQRAYLTAQIIVTASYLTLLMLLSYLYGVEGAATAYLIGQSLEAIITFIPTLLAYRRRSTLIYHKPFETV